jgi:hypothetical protein
MAAPAYTEDLTDIDLAASTTGWVAYGGGGAGLGVGIDFGIQGSPPSALDKQVSGASGAEKGAMHLDATVTLGASDHVIGWIFCGTPGLMDILANRGMHVSIGDDTSNFNKYAVQGSDTLPEGTYKPYAIRFSTSTPSPGNQTGTPSATPDHFGGGLNVTGTSKGINLGLDAFRYGTGAYITAGDGTTPATMSGFADADEALTAKWGLMYRLNGAYQWQGRFAVGQNNAGTPTAAHMDDEEVAAVYITDTPHSQTDFTQWIIDHASTVFNMANKTFFSQGTNNPGKFVINNASATSTGWKTCVWNDVGTLQGHVNVPYVGCSFNRCDNVDQNAGTFTDCVFDSTTATAAITGSNPGIITDSHFISDGSSHGVECDTTGTYNWNGNTDEGYTGTRGSNLVASTGSTNAMFYNNSGGLVTLNVGAGGQSPSVRNAAGSTTQVNATVNVTFAKMKDNTEVLVDLASTGAEIAHIENVTGGTTDDRTYTWSSTAGTVVDYTIHHFEGDGVEVYETIKVKGYTVPSSDTTIDIQQRVDLNVE